jgi:6-pyruvoyl-tetrahydropterin synthase related domain
MYTLAREWLPRQDAMAAGVLFAVNPYHLVTVYWRSDFAELLASALIPLAVLFALRTATAPRRSFAPLALVTAAVCLSNAPAAVVVTYGIGLILVVVAVRERSVLPLIYGGGALALGFALASFYIVPAMVEQPWVNISEVLAQGLRYPENFLFTRTVDAEHTRFNFIVSWVAVAVIVATIATIIIEKFPTLALRRVGHPPLWWAMAALAATSTVLMVPLASPAWAYLPELRYVQFPWRWLLMLDVAFALCVTAALGHLRGTWRRAGWVAALAGLAIIGFCLTRSNWWDPGGAADFYEEHFSKGAGYFGVDEYGPRGSDHYDLDQKAPLVSLRPNRGEGSASVKVEQWGAGGGRLVVYSPWPVTAALRLLNYPAWRVEVNGKAACTASSEHTRQMLVPLPAGTSRLQLSFVATPDRLWSDAVSAVALLALLAGMLASRRRSAKAAE